uniref:Uncharacterized protein n=1 Tax=Populus davidiana TaxID=266767 RepID=A0A6M2EKL3_9ROSI
MLASECLPLLVTPMPAIKTTITLGGRSESISIIYPFSLSTVVYFWARRVLMERKRWVTVVGDVWWSVLVADKMFWPRNRGEGATRPSENKGRYWAAICRREEMDRRSLW